MIKRLSLSDKLIEMTIAYEAADLVKAQELGTLISSTMQKEAGIMSKPHLSKPARFVITDRNERITARHFRCKAKKVRRNKP